MLDLVRPLVRWVLALALLCSVPARGAEEAIADEPSPPIQNQDTPRNVAYSFIMLAREGAWDDAALLLHWPQGMDDLEATPEKVARALKLLLDERI